MGAAQQAVVWWLTEVQQPLLKALQDGEEATVTPPEQLVIITGRGRHRNEWQRSANASEPLLPTVDPTRRSKSSRGILPEFVQ